MTIHLLDQQGERRSIEVSERVRITPNLVVVDPATGDRFTIRGRQINPADNSPIPNSYVVVWTDKEYERRNCG